MHELPIAKNLLKLVLEHARRAGVGPVRDVHLAVGALSSVMGESMQFYWDFLTQGTPAEGSTLHFRRIPMALECNSCHHTFEPMGEDFRCPVCTHAGVRVIAGDDLCLEAIDADPLEVTGSSTEEVLP